MSKYFVNSIVIFARIRSLKLRLRNKTPLFYIIYEIYLYNYMQTKETQEIWYLNHQKKKKTPHNVVYYK